MTVSMIIGGGQSQRMGQDKSGLKIEGRTLLERTIDALSFSSEILVVAPPAALEAKPDWPPVRFTQEDPPFGGPVAGLVAGVAAWSHLPGSQQVIILPVDMPKPAPAAQRLAAADLSAQAARGPDGVAGDAAGAVDEPAGAMRELDGAVLEDEEGWPQYLLGRYRLAALRRAAQELGDPRNKSMRRFGRLLNVAHIPMANTDLVDVDTPEDAKAHGIAVKNKKRKDDPEVLARLEKWQKALRVELDISDSEFDQEKILDLAAIIAKDVARPGVPVTAYLVGLAAGRAIERGENPQAAVQRILDIAGNPAPLLGEDA